MDIEGIITKELRLEDNFDYRTLFNDDRGAVHKDDYKVLLKWSIKEKIIDVKKYLIKENVDPDAFYNIADKQGEGYYQLKEGLKDYHQESYYNIAPFIYLLDMLEPNYRLNNDRKELEEPIIVFPNNIIVGHRFERTNAFSRLYFKDSKIAVNSFNDSVENLADTLEIDGITVYVLDVERILHKDQNIVIYKLTKNDMFNELKYKAEHRFLDELFNLFKNKS